MTTYQELYDDATQELRRYKTEVTFNGQQFMRYLSQAMQDIQKRMRIIKTEKNLYRDNDFDLGDDVLEIVEVIDEDDNKIDLVSYESMRAIMETGVIGRTVPEGSGKPPYNEFPYSRDLRREPPETDNELWGKQSRICCVQDAVGQGGRILFYPDRGDELINISYYPRLHVMSSASDQWQEWYPTEAHFERNFQRLHPAEQFVGYEKALVCYVVAQYLEGEVTILSENKGMTLADVWWKKYEKELTVTPKQPKYNKHLVVPYGISPYS